MGWLIVLTKGFAVAAVVGVLGVETWTTDWWLLIICLNIIAQDLNN